MSMNKYMHPRNIYKNPPNFKQLALQYPEFRKYVKQDITGKVTLDFKDVNALRALSRTLLIKDFDLNVELPENKLIPTIPLRLNYLLWIEDLLSLKKSSQEKIFGIDIGTGASCVYPLMAAQKFKWHMIGTEIDETSEECAKRNVSQNFLSEYVKILKVNENSILQTVLKNEKERIFDFCMCNPPFFSTKQELHPFFKSRKVNRPHPKNAFCASENEVVVNGGEIEFATRMIRESTLFKQQVIIFTVMVGHKSSLNPLKSALREVEVSSFKQTEFCQGHTTRWGLAWTFHDIDLRSIPTTSKELKVKSKPPLGFIIPDTVKLPYTFQDVNSFISNVMNELKFNILEHKTSKEIIVYDVIAYENTWSNQRRKRREKLNLKNKEMETTNKKDLLIDQNEDSGNSSLQLEFDDNVHSVDTIKLSEMAIASVSPKREHEEEEEYYKSKKIKTHMEKPCYTAKFFLSIKKEHSHIKLELFTMDHDTNREVLHQILQYLKNNLS